MTEEEILKTAKEIADKAAELTPDQKNTDREMAYQQFTDLKTFLSTLEMIEMRIKYDGKDSALSVIDVYKHNIAYQLDNIVAILEGL